MSKKHQYFDVDDHENIKLIIDKELYPVISPHKPDVPTRRKNIFDVVRRRHVPLMLEDSNPGGHAVF